MITVKFKNQSEIRMGSPYNICDISITGNWTPMLPDRSWQDKTAFNSDETILALVAWDIRRNKPGFSIFYLDMNKKTIKESKRFVGCCHSIEWSDSLNDFKTETI